MKDEDIHVEQHLIPLDLQLTPLVELGVPQTDSTELQVLLEHLLVVVGKVALAVLVDHLTNTNHISSSVLESSNNHCHHQLDHEHHLDRRAHHGSGAVASQLVNILVKPEQGNRMSCTGRPVGPPGVLITVVDIAGLASLGHVADYADPPRHSDLVLAHLFHCRITAHVEQV